MSDPVVDPLQSFTGISLFPRTIRAPIDVNLPSDPSDLNSVHHFMKFLTMSSPERVMYEAKAIVDTGPELLNSQFAKFVESVGIDKDAVAPQGNEKPQERRPGLGRKRARFSLKPNSSQPPVTLVEPSLNIDQLQDPEEFFSAYERLENAKREIEKQKGGTVSDLNEYKASLNARRRRPGILGKSASYKHRYSSVLLESDEMITSSHETLQQVFSCGPGHGSQDETNVADVETDEIDLVESITTTEHKVNDILDELLSKDGKDLDEDGALSLLQERLQIKPIDLGNLDIPEFQGIGRTDFKALGERLPKAGKSVSNMSTVIKQLSGEAPKKHKDAAENPRNPIGTPTPPRNPFASLSLLKMHALQSNQSRDPFSPLNVDMSDHRNPFSFEDMDKPLDQVDAPKDFSMYDKSRTEMEDEADRPSGSEMDIHTTESRGSECLLLDSLDMNLEGHGGNIDTRPNGSKRDLQDNEIHQKTMDWYAAKGTETSGLTNGPGKMTEDIGDMSKVALSSGETHLNVNNSSKSGDSSDVHMHESSQVEQLQDSMPFESAIPAEQDVNIHYSASVETFTENQPVSDLLTSTACEEHAGDSPSTTVETNSAKSTEDQAQKQKQQRKEKRSRMGIRESKAFVLRPSLAAAGTSFESGVRRSKRIRTRPLEYWKGERLLYGRIDKSLKLIGVKYASPSKHDGNLTVKSYVPDKYKDIVQLASHH